jgi:hypothetical protein
LTHLEASSVANQAVELAQDKYVWRSAYAKRPRDWWRNPLIVGKSPLQEFAR